MIIREIMHENPITIPTSMKLAEAYKLMNEKNIRHLPVMEGEKLVGIISDRDLRLATSKLAEHPFDPGTEVKQIMSHPVESVMVNEPIESALQLMRELKIGCLPVLEGNVLVGIVTGADILDAMLHLTGSHKPSGRMDIRLHDKPGELARLTALLAEKKINIHSILSYLENGKTRLVLRLNTIEMRLLADELCKSGFEVVWPPHISCKD